MKHISIALIATTVSLLSGCGPNGFLKHYTGARLEPIPSDQPIFRTAKVPDDCSTIGTAEFLSSAGEGNKEAIAAARKVGAHGVVWDSEYIDTTVTSGVTPITTPTTTTTYHGGTVWGNGGSASYSGYSTTRGTRTTYIPYTNTRHWYKYRAQFYREDDN